jgi:hypothetical protein
MITIFYDFGQFSAKLIGVFLKSQYYDEVFAKTGSCLRKNATFRRIFRRKNCKNHNIGPWSSNY